MVPSPHFYTQITNNIMTIIDWFPKNKRKEFWVMDLTSLYRFITAYIRQADQDSWADYFAVNHICTYKYYPALKDLVVSYAISVFKRRLKEGKRKHGDVFKVISNALAGPVYMFAYQISRCVRENGDMHIPEALPINYCFAALKQYKMPVKICPATSIRIRQVPLFGYVSREWTSEHYAPYVTMLVKIPLEEKMKMLWRMWLKEHI